MGEEEVRKNLTSGLYGERNSRRARAWLEEKDQQRKSDIENKNLELAERAVHAAECSAVSSKRANNIARSALILSFIAIAISVFGLYFEVVNI